MDTPRDSNIRLEYLRAEIQEERMSWEEIAELKSLLKAAGLEEFPESGEDFTEREENQ